MAIKPKKPWWTNWDLNYVSNIYGPIYGGHSVQEAFYNTIQLWFPTYIAEFNRKIGADILEVPKEYRLRPDYRPLPKDPSVAVLVNVPHTVGTPEVYNAGVRASWRVDVELFIFGTQDWQETQALTYAYATALRALILQNRGLGGIAQTTEWMSDEYLEGEHSSTRTTGIAHLTFVTTLGNVGTTFGGPETPSIAPPAAAPEVETPDITIEVDTENDS